MATTRRRRRARYRRVGFFDDSDGIRVGRRSGRLEFRMNDHVLALINRQDLILRRQGQNRQ